mmetsp:Transcript_35909/g.36134  ORF Transcript_35909/g.36134 Transcript_35909/m.36134 type:complete len:96 (-) Transcript_35909:168-455(-)
MPRLLCDALFRAFGLMYMLPKRRNSEHLGLVDCAHHGHDHNDYFGRILLQQTRVNGYSASCVLIKFLMRSCIARDSERFLQLWKIFGIDSFVKSM